VQVLPLLLGVLLRQKLQGLAERLERPLEKLANVLLLLLLVVILIKAGPTLPGALAGDPGALPAMALLILVSLGLGWRLGGDQPREELTSALVTAMRNPGLALLFAGTHGKDLPGLKVWILVYVLITVLLSFPLVRRGSRRSASA
jgi:predicted Na+-dependent transporter